MQKLLRPVTDEQELISLQNAYYKNTISRQDQQRLFACHREQFPGMGDGEISLMLIAAHPDYEKPDENGEVKTI